MGTTLFRYDALLSEASANVMGAIDQESSFHEEGVHLFVSMIHAAPALNVSVNLAVSNCRRSDAPSIPATWRHR